MIDRIGPYTVHRELGRGGMGVVYLGEDTRLDRAVAIKALPEHLASEPGRLARFEVEARALAQLSHPNIAGIYGIEEHEGANYLILEYVEGETLAERLGRGPLAIDDTMDLAIQIAEGIGAAHDRGVVHRDLKPGNIIVTPEGRAKVLDFGLARFETGSDSTGGDVMSQSPTLPAVGRHSPTLPGVVLGTAAYMSPEQARGRAVDKRTDIWSFGVLLYEMLVGSNPFQGENASDSIGAVLHKDPDLSALPPATPANVRRVLERCLVRDQAQRFRDIGDLRIELTRASDGTGPGPVGTGRSIAPATPIVLLVLLAVVAGGGWFASSMLRPGPPERVVSKADIVVVDSPTAFVEPEPKISPDGTMIAYKLDGRIQLRRLDSFDSRPLPGTEHARGLFWSPDSRWIGYQTGDSIFKISVNNGNPIKLTDEVHNFDGSNGGAWTADGRIVFSGSVGDARGLTQISARGGKATMLLEIDPDQTVGIRDVSGIPGTNTVLYLEADIQNAFLICAYDGSERVVVSRLQEFFVSLPTFSPSGHILYTRLSSEFSIWAIGFDLGSLEPIGEPFLVEQNATQPSVSGDGILVFQRGLSLKSGKYAVFAEDGGITSIDDDAEYRYLPSMSPDQRMVAFSAGPVPRFDIWSHDLTRGITNRVTFAEMPISVSSWSSDGREIAATGVNPEVGMVARTYFYFIDGSGESRPSIEGWIAGLDRTWEHAVVMDTTDPSGVYALSMDDPSQRTRILTVEGQSNRPIALSPDGTLLAYASNESGGFEVYCTRFPGGTGKWQVSAAGGSRPQWSADSRRLYFQTNADEPAIQVVDVSTDPEIRFGTPQQAFADIKLGRDWCVAPDGKALITTLELDGSEQNRVSISLVQNWYQAFAKP